MVNIIVSHRNTGRTVRSSGSFVEFRYNAQLARIELVILDDIGQLFIPVADILSITIA